MVIGKLDYMSFHQPGLFGGKESLKRSEPEEFALDDASVLFYRDIFDENDLGIIYDKLDKTSEWKQEKITVFGKTHDVPRLTAWYGENGIKYTYSGIEVHSSEWTQIILEIKQLVEDRIGYSFNSVLLNKYRDGKDKVSWHSDDEKELGKTPVIASVSFGGTRVFKMKHKRTKKVERFSLHSGSVLVMAGETQSNWLHEVPRTAKKVEPRINLTFRFIDA